MEEVEEKEERIKNYFKNAEKDLYYIYLLLLSLSLNISPSSM